MKLISLLSVAVGVMGSGTLRSELTSSFGSKNIRKREKQSRKMGYGEIGSLMEARQGNSLCSLRSNDPQFQCCDGVDLQCYGCNQHLLNKGQKRDDQTASTTQTHRRDCFCDTSCIVFEDCCDDHPVTCKRLYDDPETTTSTTTTTTTTTTDTTT